MGNTQVQGQERRKDAGDISDGVREGDSEKGLVGKTNNERTISAEVMVRVLRRADSIKYARDYAEQKAAIVKEQIPLGQDIPVSVAYEIAEKDGTPREDVDAALRIECPTPEEMQKTLNRIGSIESEDLTKRKKRYACRRFAKELMRILQDKLPEQNVILEIPQFDTGAHPLCVATHSVRKRKVLGFEIPFFKVYEEIVHASIFYDSVYLETHKAAESYVEISAEMNKELKERDFKVKHCYDPDGKV